MPPQLFLQQLPFGLIFQNIDEDQFITKVARTPEEACKLREVGFEKFDELDGVRLYCKRK